ncbi:PLP-dependent aminotransferase family protein [Nocardiopsis changdeensis]|uniref:PLP-dependent aminotransferase family protein n=1 Tax=Nocardiopsis changdeensis TaxID=2831969 RepID=A0ABX8BWZ9_9ACTN|nr:MULTISPECIES: PLP-dependent aminotransferase family protein [Nocardiopsis]QUX25341.1 PLP-dependent aminotransferase family protein [Nocardiopsis changdeensis]QYX35728.1 PLP-dependent aminotransferase family protein [Nocardiopsis sp. MT53]
MERTWAISGIDLHVEVGGTRVARSLERELRAAVTGGRLPAGTRLPSSRTLGADLGIARNTVAEVYGRLAAEGWLESRVGAGTWVARRPGPPPAGADAEPPPPPALDLRGGIPDPSAFPRGEWAAALRRAVESAPADAFDYPDPRGAAPLREALAGYTARARGVRARAENVVVGHGFGDLLALLCRALARRGARRIAVEAYGHGRHRRIAAAHGLEPVPVPVDADGADVAALEGLDVGAVLLTPAHQFPTGAVLSPERRRALVRWAQRRDALVLEDDYDGEFRYDRRAVGAVQALAPDRVVYLGTASKSLAPGLGTAWAVAPAGLVPELVGLRELSGAGHHVPGQLALADLITSHRYDLAVRRARAVHRDRRRAVAAAVAGLPGCSLSGPEAGLHCPLELPAGVSEAAVSAEAARRGLALEGLASFGSGAPERGPAMVIGYGAPRPHLFAPALAAAVAAVAAHLP